MEDALRLISSRDNPRFKQLQKLIAQPRLLRKQGLAVAEGIHLLQELASWQGLVFQEVWLADSLRHHREWAAIENALDAALESHACEVFEVPDELYGRLSELEQGRGPLVVFRTPLTDDNTGTGDRPPHDILLLDGIQDPGNVGTLIRTAAAVGIREIWTTPDCAWVWSGKVLRAAMGGHKHVRLPGLPDNALERLHRWADAGTPVRLTQLAQSASVFETDLRLPGVWLLGSEGLGVSDAWSALANTHLRIPMQAGVESLNVASAAAVCLYEQWRQRQAGHPSGAA